MNRFHWLAVAVALAAVTAGVALAVYISQPVSNPCGGTGGGPPYNSPPLGSAMAVGASQDTTRGSDHWYNFTIEAVSPTLTVHSLSFEVKGPAGNLEDLPPGSGISMVDSYLAEEAAFIFGTGWYYFSGFGPGTLVTTSDTLSLFYAGAIPATLVGGSLVAYGTTACGGEVSGTIT